MDRLELKQYIFETYGIGSDYPWMRHPDCEVFRHSKNQKWFALIMDVPKTKLGLQGTGVLSVVNLKSSPVLIGSLVSKNGFFPAYHMNKENWISLALDGSVSSEEVQMLLDMSFELTAAKVKKHKEE